MKTAKAEKFPNLFLPEAYRSVPPEQVPEEEVTRAHDLLARAVASKFQRVIVPVILPGGQRQIKYVRLYSYLQNRIDKSGLEARVLPGEGLVRSAIGGIYAELMQEYERNPHMEPATVLNRIIDDKADIAIQSVAGVGSDIDSLVVGADAKQTAYLLQEMVNSIRNEFGIGFSKEGESRHLIPLGDVKDYDGQVNRSVSQGGATCDFLAIDLRSNTFIDPAKFPKTSENLVRGILHYAGEDPGTPFDIKARCARAMRARLEIPFLNFDRESEAKLSRDLDEAIASVRKKPERAVDQVGKAIRNSRFSGAANLLFRSPERSVEAKYLKFTRALRRPFPEFLERFPIGQQPRDRNGIPPSNYIAPEKFFHITKGVALHGTGSDNFLSILRNNFILSKPESSSGPAQGGAAFGTGVYTTTSFELANEYAGKGGVVLNLRFREVPLNVLDMNKFKKTPFYNRIKAEAAREGVDVNEILGKRYGVDVIMVDSNVFLVLNSDVFHVLPPEQLAEVSINKLADPKVDEEVRQHVLSELFPLISILDASPQGTSERIFKRLVQLVRAPEVARATKISVLKTFPAMVSNLSETSTQRREHLIQDMQGASLKWILTDRQLKEGKYREALRSYIRLAELPGAKPIPYEDSSLTIALLKHLLEYPQQLSDFPNILSKASFQSDEAKKLLLKLIKNPPKKMTYNKISDYDSYSSYVASTIKENPNLSFAIDQLRTWADQGNLNSALLLWRLGKGTPKSELAVLSEIKKPESAAKAGWLSALFRSHYNITQSDVFSAWYEGFPRSTEGQVEYLRSLSDYRKTMLHSIAYLAQENLGRALVEGLLTPEAKAAMREMAFHGNISLRIPLRFLMSEPPTPGEEVAFLEGLRFPETCNLVTKYFEQHPPQLKESQVLLANMLLEEEVTGEFSKSVGKQALEILERVPNISPEAAAIILKKLPDFNRRNGVGGAWWTDSSRHLQTKAENSLKAENALCNAPLDAVAAAKRGSGGSTNRPLSTP